MSGRRRWVPSDTVDGVVKVKLRYAKWFPRFVDQELSTVRTYVFRGQRDSRWQLEPTLDRILRQQGDQHSPFARRAHLARFQMAARGRRGPAPKQIDEENEWWALGQHHGLATPLLDWTESPFVAAYFAYEDPEDDGSGYRSVWALHSRSVLGKSSSVGAAHQEESRAPVVEIVRPMSDENPRLVNQRGVFTRGPDGVTTDDWVRQNFAGETKYGILLHIMLPSKDRASCLRLLNRMNINHLSLFPDLYGASRYCNFDLTIKGY